MGEQEGFRRELEVLQHEFEEYLARQLSKRTIRKHAHVIGLFIDFICFDCRIHHIQEITRGMANSMFRKWYMNKVGDLKESEVKVAVKKFFQFLDCEKGIKNEAVLRGFKR